MDKVNFHGITDADKAAYLNSSERTQAALTNLADKLATLPPETVQAILQRIDRLSQGPDA